MNAAAVIRHPAVALLALELQLLQRNHDGHHHTQPCARCLHWYELAARAGRLEIPVRDLLSGRAPGARP